MKKYSKSLKEWGNVLIVFGAILFVVGIFSLAFDTGSWPLTTGACMIVLSPVVHGFATVVQNAEEQIEERHEQL